MVTLKDCAQFQLDKECEFLINAYMYVCILKAANQERVATSTSQDSRPERSTQILEKSLRNTD